MGKMETNWKPTLADSQKPLYLAIVDAIAKDIAGGNLAIDTKLPTHRELADSMGIAVGTVTRAYAEAEHRGLIRSEGRRGTFVGEPRTNLSYLSTMAKRPSLGIDLSKNHPLYGLDPDLSRAMRSLVRRKGVQSLLEYPPAAGLMRHRECGARWMSKLGARAEPESIFVTGGAQHALLVILAAETQRGDTIASEKFTYPGLKAIAELLGLQVVGIPTDEEGIVPDALESLCRQKRFRILYCNPSLQNPTNSVCPLSRRKEIADVADRHGVTVIEDEIMRPFLSEDHGFISQMIPDKSYLVISVSKSIAAGLRTGFVLAPAGARQRIIESLNASCLGVTPIASELFSLWLEDGTVDRIISQRLQDTSARQEIASRILKDFKFSNHPASYHLWLKLPEGWTAMKLAAEAQLRGTVIAPGEFFSVDQKPTLEAVRLSVIIPARHDLLETGLNTIAELLYSHSGHHLPLV